MTSSPLSASDSVPCRRACSRLLIAAGFSGDFRLEQLSGGANNRVYRVDLEDRSLLLKEYFCHPDDPRDRLATEFAFVGFAWENGIQAVPQPFGADADNQLGLYEFVEGPSYRPGEIKFEHVQTAFDFFAKLNRLRDLPAAGELPVASEACFTLADHLACVGRRIESLQTATNNATPPAQFCELVTGQLVPVWERTIESFHNQASCWKLGLDEELPADGRCLSPSDFGFHNALRESDGRTRFLDFEYAGWDDPAKIVCDFFCQVSVPVPREFVPRFTQSVLAEFPQPEKLRRRIRLLFPVYQVKWCCIVLNEFLPTENARRRFSGSAGNEEDRTEQQLERARRLLGEISMNPLQL